MSSARKARSRKKRRAPAPITVQVHFLISKPRGAVLTDTFLREVFHAWVMDGEAPRNIEVRAIEWQSEKREGSEDMNKNGTAAGIDEARMRLRAVLIESNVSLLKDRRCHLSLSASG